MSEAANSDNQPDGLPKSRVIGLILGPLFLLMTLRCYRPRKVWARKPGRPLG